MAISAKFIADFSSFQEAVNKSVISLEKLRISSASVEKSLNKMTDSFSGEQIKREATLVEKSIEKIGGASKLTAKEQEQVNKTVTDAIAKYKALGQEAPASLQKLADETKKVEQAMLPASKATQGFLDAFKGTLAGMVSAAAIIGTVKAAFGALTEFIGSSVKAYADAESAQKKLTAALTAAGRATPGVIGDFNKLSKEFQQATVYSDDLVTEMQALLVQVGNVMPHQMEGALQAATNLASGLGIDLRQATLLVGKAFEGETGTLKRYGIVIDEAKLKAEGMPAVLEAIQSKFGGQAQAEAESYAGKIKQLANEWDNLKEAVGKSIVEDPLVIAGLRALTNELTGVGESADSAGVHITAFAAGLITNSPQVKAFIEILGGLQKVLDDAGTSARKLGSSIPQPAGFKGETGPTVPIRDEEIAQLAHMTEAQLEAEKAAKAHAEAIKRLADSFSDANLQRQARDLAEATARLADGHILSAREMDNVGAAAKRLYDQGAKLPPNLFNIMVATEGLLPPMQALSQEMLTSLGPAFKSVYDLSAKLPPVLNGLSSSIGTTFAVQMPEQVQEAIDVSKELEGAFQDLSSALSDLAQVSGGAFGDIVQQLATMVAAANTAAEGFGAFKTGLEGLKIGEFSQGLSAMAGGALSVASAFLKATEEGNRLQKTLSGALVGLQAGAAFGPIGAGIGAALGGIGGLFRDIFGNAGRDAVKAFAESFDTSAVGGGFDELHAKLLELDRDGQGVGERLWIALTQGVGRNSPEQAQRVIAEIQAALAKLPEAAASPADLAKQAGYKTRQELQEIADKARAVYDYMRESGQYSAAQIADAFQKSKDAQIAAMDDTAKAAIDSFKKQMDAIDAELKSLQASVAAEAPEDVMGVIEAQARERIAQLAQERERVQAELDAAMGSVQEGAENTQQAVEGIDQKLRDNAAEWENWHGRVRTAVDDVNRATSGVAPPSPTGGGGVAAPASTTTSSARTTAIEVGRTFEEAAAKVSAAADDLARKIEMKEVWERFGMNAEDAAARVGLTMSASGEWVDDIGRKIEMKEVWERFGMNAEEAAAKVDLTMGQTTEESIQAVLELNDSWFDFYTRQSEAAHDFEGTIDSVYGSITDKTGQATDDMAISWEDLYDEAADAAHDLERRLGLEYGSIQTLTGRALTNMTNQWRRAGDAIVDDFDDVARDVELSMKGIDVPTIRIPVEFENPNMPEPEPQSVPGFQSGTRGKFLDFGAGTMVRLHGRERIMTDEEARPAQGSADWIRPETNQSRVSYTFQPGSIVVHGTADRQFAKRLLQEIALGGDLLTDWQRIKGR